MEEFAQNHLDHLDHTYFPSEFCGKSVFAVFKCHLDHPHNTNSEMSMRTPREVFAERYRPAGPGERVYDNWFQSEDHAKFLFQKIFKARHGG